jgi:subtilisin-like proprotein convertase family protein
MRFSSRTWAMISVTLLVAGAVCLWLDRRLVRGTAPAEPVPSAVDPATPGAGAGAGARYRQDSPFGLLSLAAVSGAGQVSAGPVIPAAAIQPVLPPGDTPVVESPPDPYLLANTPRSVDELARMESAVLLENAFLDTAAGALPGIPEHLRAGEEPGAYLVQSWRPLDRAFYEQLEAVGAGFVAYVPNNTALVVANSRAASRLEGSASVRAVLPYAPYFKLSRELLPTAVDGPGPAWREELKVLVYPGMSERAGQALAGLGVQTVHESRSPFGVVLRVRSPADALVPLAQLTEVQRIEVDHPRILMNDLARVRVGVSTNFFTNSYHLELSGQDILVNLNDSGVDARHPGLRGRVTTRDTNALTLVDPQGHGTHVAGTLAGTGAQSEDSTNVIGSLPNASFAGMATNAEIFVLPIDLATGPLVSDVYLQEEAAAEYFLRRRGTNTLVSNNSWTYPDSRVYDLEAASYDAATRDALPDIPGMHPILFVFPAGNRGEGNDNGLGGLAGSIGSPATAKNVITVGALEQPRFIDSAYYVTNIIEGTTNEVVSTNTPFLRLTDSDNQVASYSSRGNVGIGREGTSGRFKPDVVAPGSFLVSARAQDWELEDSPLFRGEGTNSPLYPLMLDLTAGAGPEYRYETGSSMAAPVVSGMLALMQEFFEQTLQRSYSPALLKALLLHGTRPVNPVYNLEVRKIRNEQGWGLPNLPNSLPEIMATEPEDRWPLRIYADPITNVLATGQSHTWNVQLSSNAQFVPFRATLVWTDPPGNPGAAVKLVNDLDLVVTNLATDEVFYGNYIVGDSEFSSPRDTNAPPVTDLINNVENIIMPPPEFGTNEVLHLSVTVSARRVNVNAVTANTQDVVQDYALIFSAGEGVVTNPIDRVEWEPPAFELLTARVLTNAVAELRQRAGAHFQLAPGMDGVTNQWAFFVFTNTFFTNQVEGGLTNGSNVAFITFLPPNLSRPRNVQSDIDLYVSKDRRLLDLDPEAIANADKSRKRGGTELILYTNATPTDVFYVGVKAEDQQGSEFGLVVLSTDLPFSDTDEFGNQRLFARGVPVSIPDGSPEDPGGMMVFAFPQTEPVEIVGATAEVTFNHENIGDLVAILGHIDQSVTLHNHNLQVADFRTNFWHLVYEDTPSGNFPMSQPSDGPGSLNNFIGQTSEDVWMFSVVDDAPGNVGTLEAFTLRLAPNLLDPDGVTAIVLPNQWRYFITNVPIGAVSFTAALTAITPQLPLDLYLRREAVPTFDEFDKYARIPGDTGGELTLTRFDSPPLNPGRMFIGVYNPNDVPVTFTLQVFLEIDLNAIQRGGSLSDDTPMLIQDDARTRSTIFVSEDRPVVDVQVGLRVEHERASDLVFHLISPQGTRVLLAENRGGTSPDGYGSTILRTNVASAEGRGGPQEDRNVIDTGVNRGILTVDYEFWVEPDSLHIYYDGDLIYTTGVRSGGATFSVGFGPGDSTELVIVVNQGGSPRPTTRWIYTATVLTTREVYTVFTEQTNLATTPIKFASPPFIDSPGAVASTNRPILLDGFEVYAPEVYPAPVPLGLWRVRQGAVEVHGPGDRLGVPAFEGTNFVELIPGVTPASLAVDLTTTRSARYGVSVAARRNPATPDGIPQALGLYADGVRLRSVTLTGNEWQTVTASWAARDIASLFEIRTLTSGGPLIDAVEISELLEGGEAYFLAEEDLMRNLKAESPLGLWTLEMRDDRVGPSTTNTPHLVSWTLNFIFANTNPPVTPLLPCRLGDTRYGVFDVDCNQLLQFVQDDAIQYFSVQAPLFAGAVTNLVVSRPDAATGTGELVLLYSATGLPTGFLPGDVVIDTPSPDGQIQVLTTNSVPPLVPGQRYYLGVANRFPTETNAFLITAEFDQVDGSLVTAPFLEDGVVQTNTIAHTNVLQYYQFQVATNATTHVTFDLVPRDGDVDLFLRKAQPIPNPLPGPGPTQHDYSSQNSGTNAELVILTRRSFPVPLDEGLWYLGVLNRDTNAVTYTLLAREWADLVTLTNDIGYVLDMPATNGLRYFEIQISEFAQAATFSLTDLSGDLDLYVSRVFPGALALPDTNRYDYASTQPGLADEVIVVDPFGSVPLSPGYWYLAVANPHDTPASGTVTVSQMLDVPPNVIPLQDGIPLAHTIPVTQLEATYFLLRVANDSPAVLFELYDLNQEAELLLEYSVPPLPGLATWRSSGDPALPPQIVLRANRGDFASPIGDWYLEVVPGGLAQDLTFTIRAATSTAGILLSGRPYDARLNPGAAGLEISWNSVEGENYQLVWSTDLTNWTVLGTVRATGRTVSFTDSSWTGQPTGFYWIRQVP